MGASLSTSTRTVGRSASACSCSLRGALGLDDVLEGVGERRAPGCARGEVVDLDRAVRRRRVREPLEEVPVTRGAAGGEGADGELGR